MKQGMLYRNQDGHFAIDEETCFVGGESISIFEEDEQEWLVGKIEKEAFGEYFFTDDFFVVYLYEGLAVRTIE